MGQAEAAQNQLRSLSRDTFVLFPSVSPITIAALHSIDGSLHHRLQTPPCIHCTLQIQHFSRDLSRSNFSTTPSSPSPRSRSSQKHPPPAQPARPPPPSYLSTAILLHTLALASAAQNSRRTGGRRSNCSRSSEAAFRPAVCYTCLTAVESGFCSVVGSAVLAHRPLSLERYVLPYHALSLFPIALSLSSPHPPQKIQTHPHFPGWG